MKTNAAIFGVALLILPMFSNCSKNNPNDVIPNVYVDVTININEPSSFDLQPIGGWIYVAGGSKGLIVYRANIDEFNCYDRHSTYNADQFCRVDVDSNGFKMTDPCSASEFSIYDGSVIQGPANISLKRYPTTFDGTYIYIRN